jgi:hypothetical protein
MGPKVNDRRSGGRDLFETVGTWLRFKREMEIHFPKARSENDVELIEEGSCGLVEEVEEDSVVISVRNEEDPTSHVFHVRLPKYLDWSSYFQVMGCRHLMIVD